MAKTFSNIKKGLGLLDMLPIGKYKNCRVDSIVEHDYEYLIFMDKKGIIRFIPEVLDKLKTKFSASSIEVETFSDHLDSHNMINGMDTSIPFIDYDDIPF
jgi:hypothetical protein